jgi:hypothetical protein
LRLCVLVLPVGRLLSLKSEVRTKLENVMETLIVISCVRNVCLVFHIYSQCEYVFFGEYDLCYCCSVI